MIAAQPPLIDELLHMLLTRYEHQKHQKRPLRVYLRPTSKTYAAYFTADIPAYRFQVNRALEDLAQKGLIRLFWSPFTERGTWLQAIELVREHVEQVYAHLGRASDEVRRRELLELLEVQTPHASWQARFLTVMYERVLQQQSVAPFLLEDPSYNKHLLQAVAALAALHQPTLVRVVSARVFGDSKKLEQFADVLCALVQQYDDAPSAEYTEKVDPWLVLRRYHLEHVSSQVRLAGSIELLSAGHWLDTTFFLPDLTLAGRTICFSERIRSSAKIIISVENKTSFEELEAIRPAHVLLLLTHGFACEALLHLLTCLYRQEPTRLTYHWGDFDIGGFRILAHLRTVLPDIRPLGMEYTFLEEQHPRWRPLTLRDRQAIDTLESHTLLADCSESIHMMGMLQKKLEQETLRASVILHHLVH